jgi:hypothetical protein
MDIGGLPGSLRNQSGAINDVGQVAGQSILTDLDVFPWRVFDLNQLVDPNDPLKSTVTLLDARAINDRGQIVAAARAADFSIEYYLLTPVR